MTTINNNNNSDQNNDNNNNINQQQQRQQLFSIKNNDNNNEQLITSDNTHYYECHHQHSIDSGNDSSDSSSLSAIKSVINTNNDKINFGVLLSSSSSSAKMNLKPILKHKESYDRLNLNYDKNQTNETNATTIVPILKKRDSLSLMNDGNDNLNNNCNNEIDKAILSLQQQPPPSILKNRQPQQTVPQPPISSKGSYSFDETMTTINNQSTTLNETIVPAHHYGVSSYQQQPLKPILKKKSWSTESGTDHYGQSSLMGLNSNNDHQVKGILKSTSIDHSSPQQSSQSSSPTGPSSLLTSIRKNSINFNDNDDNNNQGSTVAATTTVSYSNSQSIPMNSAHTSILSSSSTTVNPTGLKSILKSSSNRHNRLRSTSLSPTASMDSLTLLSSNEELQTSSPLSLIERKSSFRKRASLDSSNTIIMNNNLTNYDQSSTSTYYSKFTSFSNDNDNNQIAVINNNDDNNSSTIKIKPILKSNKNDIIIDHHHHVQKQIPQEIESTIEPQNEDLNIDNDDDNRSITTSSPSSSSTSSSSSASIMEHTIENDDDDDDHHHNQSRNVMNSTSPTLSTSVTLRIRASPSPETLPINNKINKNNIINNAGDKQRRPKSCFLIGVADNGGGGVSPSISERLALLKQNGEHGWRKRIMNNNNNNDDNNKNINTNINSQTSIKLITNDYDNDDDHIEKLNENINFRHKSSDKTTDLANRLSLLMDSQSNWRQRVPEKDANKFTAASKLTKTNDKDNNNDDMDKVTLRETPKRHGLRGSTLSEKKLGAISSKLNNVFGKDKSPFAGPPPNLRSPTIKTKSSNDDHQYDADEESSKSVVNNDESNETKTKPKLVKLIKPDDDDSFGSFYGIDSKKIDKLITKTTDSEKEQQNNDKKNETFDSIDATSIQLLPDCKKTRVPAPRHRRQPTGKNPLSNTSITIDEYKPAPTVTPTNVNSRFKKSTRPKSMIVMNGNYHNNNNNHDLSKMLSISTSSSSSSSSTPISSPKRSSIYFDSKYAVSALAGLASVEDFKAVANKLKNNNIVRNDSWRTFDLKNSIQSKMLILIKGRRKAHTRLIEPCWRSLNQMDSFILIKKDKIISYIGQYSNIIERTKCMEISNLIHKRKDLCFRSSNSHNESTLLIDCQNIESNSIEILRQKLLPLLNELNFDENNDLNEFENLFMSPKDNEFDIDDDDEFYETNINQSNVVYNVNYDEKKSNSSNEHNDVELQLLINNCGRQPRHSILQQDKALIFDFGSEMYVWLGKTISNALRKKAVDAAKELWSQGYDYSEFDCSPFGNNNDSQIKCDKRPDWAWFIRVNQNMEPILLKDKFFNWPAFTLTRNEKKKSSQISRKSSLIYSIPPETPTKSHKCVKKDLSAELNLFPVDVIEDMIENKPKEHELILEFISLGRGAGDTIHDEDDLPVKILTLDVQCFYIDEYGERIELESNDKNYLHSSESYYIRWKYRLTRISRSLKTGYESRYSIDQHGGRDRLCYFVWQGKDTRNTQRGLTALNAIEKLRVEGAQQTYVEHGNEYPVFLRLFQGKLVIQNGKRCQRNANKGYRMFMLQDTLPEEQFMIELECHIKNLRSRQSYGFINPGFASKIYLWHGCKTTDAKRQSIRKFFTDIILKNRSKEFGFSHEYDNFIDYQLIDIDERKETPEFMDIFRPSEQLIKSPPSTLQRRQSKSNLHCDLYFSLIDDNRSYCFQPRLFHFHTTSDRKFVATEIVPPYNYNNGDNGMNNLIINYPFTQNDIYERASNHPTFFLFDSKYEVYLWESKYTFFISSNQSKPNGVSKTNHLNGDYNKDGDDDDESMKIPKIINIEEEIKSECNMTTGFAQQLWLAERKCALETTLAYCHAKNPSEPPKSYVISAGLEPDSFCGLFPTWTYYDNVAKLHIQDGRKPGEQILVQEILSQIEDINQSTYSYDDLKKRPLPEGINILCLESYLDDEEFEKIFLMNREEFYTLPTWKQKLMKQEKDLF